MHLIVAYLYSFLQRGTPPTESIDATNNQPHILMFLDETQELNQYFVAVKQELMLECSTLPGIVFHCLGAHFIFNLNYQKKLPSYGLFIQERIAGIWISRLDIKRVSRLGIKRSHLHLHTLLVLQGFLKDFEGLDDWQIHTNAVADIHTLILLLLLTIIVSF